MVIFLLKEKKKKLISDITYLFSPQELIFPNIYQTSWLFFLRIEDRVSFSNFWWLDPTHLTRKKKNQKEKVKYKYIISILLGSTHMLQGQSSMSWPNWIFPIFLSNINHKPTTICMEFIWFSHTLLSLSLNIH